jgi:hypothetical protein
VWGPGKAQGDIQRGFLGILDWPFIRLHPRLACKEAIEPAPSMTHYKHFFTLGCRIPMIVWCTSVLAWESLRKPRNSWNPGFPAISAIIFSTRVLGNIKNLCKKKKTVELISSPLVVVHFLHIYARACWREKAQGGVTRHSGMAVVFKSRPFGKQNVSSVCMQGNIKNLLKNNPVLNSILFILLLW